MKGAPMTKSILHFFSVVLFLLLPCLAFAEEPMPTTTDPARGAMKFKAGEIIVKFKEGIPQARIQPLLLTGDMSILDEMSNLGLMLLSVPQGRELEKVEELKRNPLVEYAVPNSVVRIVDPIAIEPHDRLRAPHVIPDDPYFPSQWNLSKIEAPAAWDITTGSAKVVIAFVDSGVDLYHNELKDKIWTNPGEIPDNGIDDDGNGFKDDVHGWDFVNWDGEPQDDYGHGTFVASIAAAETNNDIQMAGVSWGAEIMALKAFDERGVSCHWHTAGGIEYAANNGARIINLSWTLYDYIDPQPLQAAINHAHSKGALVVAAAGDSHDDSYQYPAALNPYLTADEVESIIESTAVDLGEPGRDDYFGYGRIDASAAVMATRHYLEVEPDDALYFLVCDDCDPPSRKITNPNTNCSTWSVTATATWLSISDCEGYTPSWVTVSINKGDLPGYGFHTAPITATSTMTNYVNNPKTITATVNYSSQCWRNYLPLLFKGS